MTEQVEVSPKKVLALKQKVNYLTSYYQNRIKLVERRLSELEAAVFRNDRENSGSRTTDNLKCEDSNVQSIGSVKGVCDKQQTRVKSNETCNIPFDNSNITITSSSDSVVHCEPPSIRKNLFSKDTVNTVCEGNKDEYDRKEIYDTTPNNPSVSTSKPSDTVDYDDDIIVLDRITKTDTNILNTEPARLESNVKRRACDPIDFYKNDNPEMETSDKPNTGNTHQSDVDVCAYVSNCVYNSSVTSNTGRKKQKLDDYGVKIISGHNNYCYHQKDDNESPPTDVTVGGIDAHSVVDNNAQKVMCVPLNPQDIEHLTVPLLFDSDGYAKVYIYLNYIPNRTNSNIAVAAWFNEKHPFNLTDVVSAANKNVAAVVLATQTISIFKEIYSQKFKKLCIYTCSEYLIKLYSELPRYEKNYFHKEDGKPVKNSREIILLANIKKDLEVRVNYLDIKNIYDIGIKGILELVNSQQLITF